MKQHGYKDAADLATVVAHCYEQELQQICRDIDGESEERSDG